MRGRRSKDARSRISRGRRGRSDYPDSGACSAACDAHGAVRPGARHRPSMGWLWLGLAPGARSLEPVERGMGSAALRAKPLLRGPRSLRRLERPLRRLERSLWGRARPLRRLAILRRRLLIHGQSGIETPAIWGMRGEPWGSFHRGTRAGRSPRSPPQPRARCFRSRSPAPGHALFHSSVVFSVVCCAVARGRGDTQRLAATLLKVLARLRLRLTEFTAIKEPTTISAVIRPYSIAVTPYSSLISLVKKISIVFYPPGSVMRIVRSKA